MNNWTIESIQNNIKIFQKWRDASDFDNASIEYKSFVIGTLNQLIAIESVKE